jgi:hypothetical protein
MQQIRSRLSLPLIVFGAIGRVIGRDRMMIVP